MEMCIFLSCILGHLLALFDREIIIPLFSITGILSNSGLGPMFTPVLDLVKGDLGCDSETIPTLDILL